MPNFHVSKTYQTAAYPVHAVETSGLFKRVEPFLRPEQLVSRFLKGIPLVYPNGDVFDEPALKDRIMLAMNEAEILVNRTITREAFREKFPFDPSLYKAFIHLRSEHGPILSVEKLAIVSANHQNLFTVPPEWIESANFSKNLINVIPLLTSDGYNQVTGATAQGGVAFLAILGAMNFVPAYWEIEYTAGMSNREGSVPVPVNELIGTIAAIAILSEIAPSNIYNSQSLSQDGISQSSSGLGPRLYQLRIEELEKKQQTLVAKLKGIFSSKYFLDNI